MLLIKDCDILQYNAEGRWEVISGDIAVKDGEIFAVGATPEDFTAREIIDGRGKIALPGFINAHTHSYANLIKAYGENHPLETWMYYAFLAGSMEPEDIYLSTLLGCIEMIKSGVTSCIDHLASGLEGLEAALKAYQEAGIRAVMAPMVSDKYYYQTLPVKGEDLPAEIKSEFEKTKPKSAAFLIELTETLIKKWHQKDEGLIGVMPGPSGPQRCSEELLIGLAELARKYDLGLHTHFVETKLQAITAFNRYGCTMAQYLDRLGILDDRWSLVHSVWLTDEDIRLLGTRGVSVVHNPASNLTLGSGISPINKMANNGINISLGTDGSNCGGNLTIFRSMALAAMLSKITTPVHEDWRWSSEVLTMATVGGARAMRMGEKLGTIETGKKADIILLDARTSFLTPRIDLVNQLVYSETGESVDTVIVQGKVIMRNRKITTFNEEEILARAQERFAFIQEKLQRLIGAAEKQIRFVDGVYKGEINKELGFHRTAAW
ncbi:Melamine deaminase [Moorella humiferrea]|uniref:amidohydrolase family protein n=1 Tax=Neomoorella humiferrea TaxID=676965 RepID=UPI0030CDA4A2